MTIKEMQKTYKKIFKAEFAAFVNARNIASMVADENYDYATIAEYAKTIAKSHRSIVKIADAMNVGDGDIVGFKNEDAFVKWCIMNNIEMHENESASNDEELDDE